VFFSEHSTFIVNSWMQHTCIQPMHDLEPDGRLSFHKFVVFNATIPQCKNIFTSSTSRWSKLIASSKIFVVWSIT